MPAVHEHPSRTRVAFVTEQHLGHATFAMNLRAAVLAEPGIDAAWVPVEYARDGWIKHIPMVPESVRGMLRGRHEVRAGWPTESDVTFFNTQVPAMFGGRRARGKPYVLCTDITPIQYDRMALHYGHRPDGAGPLAMLKARWNRRVFQGAAAIVGWSTWVAKSVIDDYGVSAERVHVIPPGVDLSKWIECDPRRSGPVRILFVGGDFHRKGGDVLLEAYRQLPPGTAELVVVTKSNVAPTPGVTVHHGLSPNDPDLLELYRSCHVFALPSSAEAFGIAAVEASASGLAVVAARVGGLTDIVADGETGFLVEADRIDQLAAALRKLVEDDNLRGRMGRAARSRAEERFDAGRNARVILDLLVTCAHR